jgi:hypothetical protein
MYITTKHGTEIVVLLLELLVSTAIRSYENPAISIRQVPRVFRPGVASYHHSYNSVTTSAASANSRAVDVEMINSNKQQNRDSVYHKEKDYSSINSLSNDETVPILSHNQFR